MLVKYWMSSPAITVAPEDTVAAASDLFWQRNIHTLPVADKGQLVGVLTKSDVMNAGLSAGPANDAPDMPAQGEHRTVSSLMAHHPVTVGTENTIEEVAHLLVSLRISGVPVVTPESGVAGVITRTDVFRVLIYLTGAGKAGAQIAITVLDRPGCIKALTDIVRSFGGRLLSLLSSYERVSPGYRRVYLRIFNVDHPSLRRISELLSNEGTILYMVDTRKGLREIYC
jgi:acetoin utilization protein AcuB